MFALSDLDYELCKLTLSLYNNPYLPRNIVQFFVDSLIHFIYNIFLPLILLIIKFKLPQGSDELYDNIKNALQSTQKVFDNYKSEYQRLQHYKSLKLMVEPEKYPIADEEVKIVEGREVVINEGAFGYYIPLSWSLKTFLEIPNAWSVLVKHMHKLRKLLLTLFKPNFGTKN